MSDKWQRAITELAALLHPDEDFMGDELLQEHVRGVTRDTLLECGLAELLEAGEEAAKILEAICVDNSQVDAASPYAKLYCATSDKFQAAVRSTEPQQKG